MHEVQIYQVMSPQVAGGTRFGITVPNATYSANNVYSGFVTLDTKGPFVLTKISACFTQDASTGADSGPYPGFIAPTAFEFRFWDESNGRQMFQADTRENRIDDGFIPGSMLTSRQVGQSVTATILLQNSMSLRAYQIQEECEFPAGGVIRVDARPVLTLASGAQAGPDYKAGTLYVSFLGFMHV